MKKFYSLLAVGLLAGVSTAAAQDFTPDASIEGLWAITLNGHYQDRYSLGQFEEEFIASINGNTVTFRCSGDSRFNIVGEFTSPNTLLLKKTQVVFAEGLVNVTYQVPYINADNTNDMEDLTEEAYTVVYDATKCTLDFPEHSGLLYGYFGADTGAFKMWIDAFDFVSASHLDQSSQPSIVIDGDIEAIVEDSTVEILINYTATNIPENATYYADFFADDFEDSFTRQFAESPAIITLENVEPGDYKYTVLIRAEIEGEGGETVARSQTCVLRFTVPEKSEPGDPSGIDSIQSDSDAPGYYNLQGVKVNNPANGIFIRLQGGKATKVIL